MPTTKKKTAPKKVESTTPQPEVKPEVEVKPKAKPKYNKDLATGKVYK